MDKKKKKAVDVINTIKIDAAKLQNKAIKIELPPSRPMKLQVRFPTMDGPRHISQTKLNRLIDHVMKMSNKEFEFTFMTPDFMEITK